MELTEQLKEHASEGKQIFISGDQIASEYSLWDLRICPVGNGLEPYNRDGTYIALPAAEAEVFICVYLECLGGLQHGCAVDLRKGKDGIHVSSEKIWDSLGNTINLTLDQLSYVLVYLGHLWYWGEVSK